VKHWLKRRRIVEAYAVDVQETYVRRAVIPPETIAAHWNFFFQWFHDHEFFAWLFDRMNKTSRHRTHWTHSEQTQINSKQDVALALNSVGHVDGNAEFSAYVNETAPPDSA
jgi:hypothetical protein